MTRSIFDLKPGSTVTLRFHQSGSDSFEETNNVFLGTTGDGPDARATFRSLDGSHHAYTWDAYRRKGRWVYGSGANLLQLVSVDKLPAPLFVLDASDKRQGIPLVLWQMKAYLANREVQQDATTKRFTQPAADLITDWITELEKI